MTGVTVTPLAAPAAPDSGFNTDNIHPIARALGIESFNLTNGDNQQLTEIYDFLRGDTPEMTQLELLSKLRTLEQQLGIPSLGERRLDKVHRYVKIQSQIRGLERQRDKELR